MIFLRVALRVTTTLLTLLYNNILTRQSFLSNWLQQNEIGLCVHTCV